MGPQSAVWVELLALSAVAAGVPLVWLIVFSDKVPGWLWGSAGALIIAFQLEAGFWAGILAVGWLVSASFALYQYGGWRSKMARLRSGVALAWWVAAVWAVIHALGLQPLGFSELIVLLTAAHFHYAGIMLLALTALLHEASGKPGLYYWGLFTMLGIALVALSITLTKVSGWIAAEAWSSLWMGAAGIGISVVHFQLGRKERYLVRGLWYAAGISLITGMLLAITYGLRPVFPTLALSVPAMYRWHGTLNAFAMFSFVIGWHLKKAQPRIKLRGCPKNQLQKGG